jgi:hypothetical protein
VSRNSQKKNKKLCESFVVNDMVGDFGCIFNMWFFQLKRHHL